MSGEEKKSEPIDLETLLPWSLRGSLSELEQGRVRRALELGHLSHQSLEETIAAHELANERPDSATLTALAAGDLGPEEEEAVERYLKQPQSAEDRELVEIARAAMDSAEELAAGSPSASPRYVAGWWRTVAVAASLLTVFLAAGWWTASRESGRGSDMAIAEVIELVPDDMILRGTGPDVPAVSVGEAGVTLVLVVDEQVGDGFLSLSLRDGEGSEIARVAPVRVRDDGSVHLSIAADAARRAQRIVLLGQGSEAEAPVTIHEYSFQPR